MTTWRCPVCREPLAEDGPTWRCPAGHAFDRAREGYVNLLVTHQRRARPPGDSPAMVRHRRAFLDAGWYRPLAAALARRARPGDTVLDAGCGEGHYTRDWPARGIEVWAVDIAKDAVRLAARRGNPGAHYAVASVYDLPLPDASVDLAVNVFSPIDASELARAIRPGGRLVTATPGRDHLDGLKRLLFDEPEPHDLAGPLDAAGTPFAVEDHERIRYEIVLPDTGSVADLLGMVPYAWYVDEATRERAVATAPLATTVDFVVTDYRRK